MLVPIRDGHAPRVWSPSLRSGQAVRGAGLAHGTLIPAGLSPAVAEDRFGSLVADLIWDAIERLARIGRCFYPSGIRAHRVPTKGVKHASSIPFKHHSVLWRRSPQAFPLHRRRQLPPGNRPQTPQNLPRKLARLGPRPSPPNRCRRRRVHHQFLGFL